MVENITGKISPEDYLHCLEPWAKASEKYCYTCQDRPDLECYGPGYGGWGVQTNQKAFAAYAVLAADPSFDESAAGIPRQAVLERALKTLRFSLQSHMEGTYHCTDGTSWGHTWISALGIERMMHGIEAVREHLTDADYELLQRVLISESNWLMDNYDIVAGTVENNRPESNLWNGAILHRTAFMYPGSPRADEYREKGTRFLLNSISVASDALSNVMVEGKPLSEWYIGDNFFASYACNHHGYLNVGYMVICLSNAAMLHFMYRKKNLKAPEPLYHHITELWQLIKRCTFSDGRLLRIGGDTRVRYCYCQDYVIPMWIMMAEHFGDTDCPAFESGWLTQVKREITVNGDGSFLSQRCRELASASPLYYTRLEADRAVTLSMGAYWRRIFDIPSIAGDKETIKTCLPGSWSDDYHGACLHRSNKRITSWVWIAAEGPQGLCLPPDGSDLAEWRQNLAGQVRGEGKINFQDVRSHYEIQFKGGFLTSGSMFIRSEKMIAEGQDNEIIALQKVVFAALPDETTVMVMQQAVSTDRRVYLTSVKGLLFQVPNDLFNGNNRVYYSAGGSRQLQGFGSHEELWNPDSSWINVEDRLGIIGVYGEKSLSLFRPGRRQIGLKDDKKEAGGMLYADEICYPFRRTLHSVDANTVLFDIGFIIRTERTHKETADYVSAEKCIQLNTSSCPDVRAMLAAGADGRSYLLMANLGHVPVTAGVRLPGVKKIYNLAAKLTFSVDADGIVSQKLGSGKAELFRVE
ncbi:MAG: hypothetical protein GXP33_04665 [Spirochaetes bacterium]|nr:hypothetical protein [Spirochaetota bacterium]